MGSWTESDVLCKGSHEYLLTFMSPNHFRILVQHKVFQPFSLKASGKATCQNNNEGVEYCKEITIKNIVYLTQNTLSLSMLI